MEHVPTRFSAVSKLRFGARVQTEDAQLGTLAHLALDPASRTVSHLGVRFGFGPLGQVAYVPMRAVAHIAQSEVRLAATRDELSAAKPVAAGALLWSAATAVVADGKRIGHLRQVTLEREAHTLRHLVVARALGGEVVVPAWSITALDARAITTQPEKSTVPYTPDEELHEDIRRAIEEYPRLRVEMPGIAIHVIDGVVWLEGHVSSALYRQQVEGQVRGVPGISELHNRLMTDTDLAAAVSSALANEPRLQRQFIGVYPMLGTVFLRGRVATEAQREAASAVARTVPGVKAVRNELQIDPHAHTIPELASVTNNADLVPGGS